MYLKFKSQQLTANLAVIVAAVSVFVCVVLGIMCALWSLWTFVMSQVWVNGPQAIVNPGYWLFLCEWILLGLIGRRIFGRSKEDK